MNHIQNKRIELSLIEMVLDERNFILLSLNGVRNIIAEIHSDFVVLTSDNSRSEPTEEILWDTERGFYNSNSFTVIPDRCRAIEYALGMATKKDIVAILGKGHERYIIDSEGKHPFNEREIISSFYTRVGGDSNENTTLHSD